MPLNELSFDDDLVFPTDDAVAPGWTYGKLVNDRIVTNGSGGYPDFYFPGMVLDRTRDNIFQLVFDPDDPHDAGNRQVWMWAGRDSAFNASYGAPDYELFSYRLFSYFEREEGVDYVLDGNTVTITVRPVMWVVYEIPLDCNTPLFETASNAAVMSVLYDGELGTPPPPESSRLNGRAAFAT